MTASHMRPQKTAMLLAQRIVADINRRGNTVGDRLPPERIMLEEYEVGRGTLRESLRFLELQGVIALKPGPGGGPVVQQPDATSLATSLTLLLQFANAPFRTIAEARGGLEPMMAQLAAERMSDEQLIDLRASVDTMSEHIDDQADLPGGEQAFPRRDRARLGQRDVRLPRRRAARHPRRLRHRHRLSRGTPRRGASRRTPPSTRPSPAATRRPPPRRCPSTSPQYLKYAEKKFPDVLAAPITWVAGLSTPAREGPEPSAADWTGRDQAQGESMPSSRAIVPPRTCLVSSSVSPRAWIASISSPGLVIGQSEPKTTRSAPWRVDQSAHPLGAQRLERRRPRGLQHDVGAGEHLLGVVEDLVAAEVAGHQPQRRELPGDVADHRGARQRVGVGAAALADVGDHRDLVAERLEDLPQPGVVEREVLEERVDLDGVDAVATKAGEVVLGRQVDVDRAEAVAVLGLQVGDELVDPVHVTGLVGDPQAAAHGDPTGPHVGGQAGDGAVTACHQVGKPVGAQRQLGDLVGPDVGVGIDDHGRTSFTACRTRHRRRRRSRRW